MLIIHPNTLKRRRRRKNKRIIPLIIIMLTLAGLIFVGYTYLPNSTVMSLQEYYKENFNPNQINVLSEGTYLKTEQAPILKDNQLYLPVSFVQTYLDKYIHWDAITNKLTVTTENKVIHMKTNDLTYYINNKPFNLNLPVYRENDTAYIPTNLLKELYSADFVYTPKYKIVIFKPNKAYKTATVKEATEIRYEPDIKSPIAQKLDKDSPVIFISQDKDFTKVSSSDGVAGFIPNGVLGTITDVPATVKQPEQKPPLRKPINGKVVMVWDQIDKAQANANPQRRVVHDGVNVLSPTWFSFDAEKLDGTIINIADKSYVEWAHSQGYQVWALISDNFDSKVCRSAIKDTDTRDKVIRQLLAFVSMYDLDGINIDFEKVPKEEAANYLQFLRELAPMLREQGAYLSVDMYVPSPWTAYYNRKEVAKTVDYVCVMAYDEYYSGSQTAGPVASLGFAKKGVADTLAEVPAEKIIMGMPFYIRVWREEPENDKIKLSSKAYTMDSVKSIIEKNNVKLQWLPDYGLNYGEYYAVENDKTVVYRFWNEDMKSIEEKLKVAKQYNVGGVAAWKRGFETEGIWNLIKNYMNPPQPQQTPQP